MEQLTREEIVILIDAIDALSSKKITHGFINDLFGVITSKSEEEARQIIEAQEQRNKSREEQIQKFMEDATLLKAKLINMKNAII